VSSRRKRSYVSSPTKAQQAAGSTNGPGPLFPQFAPKWASRFVGGPLGEEYGLTIDAGRLNMSRTRGRLAWLALCVTCAGLAGTVGIGSASGRGRSESGLDAGLYVAFCPALSGSASLQAYAAGTSEAGWPAKECLKMDKGPAGRSHTLKGQRAVHNWLLGGYGNDTIIGGDVGDVIWADYHPSGQPSWQSATIHAGNGHNVIYANDTVNHVWTGTNPRTVVHAHVSGISGDIHCESPGIVLFLSTVSERHFKRYGCHHISHYSVGY
jgi:hypothetical protein